MSIFVMCLLLFIAFCCGAVAGLTSPTGIKWHLMDRRVPPTRKRGRPAKPKAKAPAENKNDQPDMLTPP